jgi:hypothetical protein
MNLKKILNFLFIGSTFFLNACQKDLDVFIADPGQITGPDTNWVNSISASMPVTILQNNLLLTKIEDSIDINSNITTLTNLASGLTCIFPPLCCQKPNGTPVTGKVYVELLLVKTRGDMIRMAKPTSSNGRLLVSGGEFFIKLKKDGDELQLKPGTFFQVKYNDPQPSPLMKVFYGDETNPNQFNWLASDTAGTILPVTAGNTFYSLYTKNLRWINCDYFYDSVGITRVGIQTELPPNFTNANTSVYLVFNDIRSVLGMNPEISIKKFVSVKVPSGKPVTIVVLSKQGDDYYLGKQVTISGLNIVGNSNQNVKITPLKTSLIDIKSFLATL